MIAKLVVWGVNRTEAIQRMRRALAEFHVGGLKTNIPFLEELLHLDAFVSGEFDTAFLDRYMGNDRQRPQKYEEIAAIAAAVLAHRQRRANRFAPVTNGADDSAWLQAGRVTGRRAG